MNDKFLFEIDEAMNIVRLDSDDEFNLPIVEELNFAIIPYIESPTGMSATQQKQEKLAKTAGRFLLQLWYYGEVSDTDKLITVIDSLLKTLSLRVNDEIG